MRRIWRSIITVLGLSFELAASEVILVRGSEELEAFTGEPELYATLAGTLGRIHHSLGHLDVARTLLAESLFLKVLVIRRQRLDDDHLAVARSRRQLAAALLAAGESPATASVLLTRALEAFYRQKPAADWEIADAESLLGAHLAMLGRDNEAAVCLRRGWETLEATRGRGAPVTVEARARLDELEASRREPQNPG